MTSTSDQIDMALDPAQNRNALFPIKAMDIWKLHKEKQEPARWVTQDIDFTDDYQQWISLDKDQQHFLKMVLAFFASSDMIVSENLAIRFIQEVQLPESKQFLAFQNYMEGVHSETYSKMIDIYIRDEKEKDLLFNAVDNYECVKEKAEWARKWITSSNSFTERLIAFAIVEGIFFSGSFCAIYWMKEKGLLPGLGKANDYIARDEGLHVTHAVMLYREYITNRLSQERFEEIMRDAVNMEIQFINEAVPCRLVGMNAPAMAEHIKYCADQLSFLLGYKSLYGIEQTPFEFMKRIALRNKENFFEVRTSAYQVGGDDDDDDAYADI